MNSRHAIFVCVVVTASGQLGGIACRGKVEATGASGIQTGDAGTIDATSASSMGGSGSGGDPGTGASSSSGSSPGDSIVGGSSGTPSSTGRGSMSAGGSGLPASGADSQPSSSDDAASRIDSSTGGSPESGDADSGADHFDGDGFSGIDASLEPGDARGADDATATSDSASVSFSADIMPIFARDCSLSSVCHGQMNNAGDENLYLGLYSGGGSVDSQAVYSGLVGVASKEDPSMNLVTAGDSSNSYLWHKLLGDQNSNASIAGACEKAATTCMDCTTSTPCGGSMPYIGAPLAPNDLSAIESWISQGAPNN